MVRHRELGASCQHKRNPAPSLADVEALRRYGSAMKSAGRLQKGRLCRLLPCGCDQGVSFCRHEALLAACTAILRAVPWVTKSWVAWVTCGLIPKSRFMCYRHSLGARLSSFWIWKLRTK